MSQFNKMRCDKPYILCINDVHTSNNMFYGLTVVTCAAGIAHILQYCQLYLVGLPKTT